MPVRNSAHFTMPPSARHVAWNIWANLSSRGYYTRCVSQCVWRGELVVETAGAWALWVEWTADEGLGSLVLVPDTEVVGHSFRASYTVTWHTDWPPPNERCCWYLLCMLEDSNDITHHLDTHISKYVLYTHKLFKAVIRSTKVGTTCRYVYHYMYMYMHVHQEGSSN